MSSRRRVSCLRSCVLRSAEVTEFVGYASLCEGVHSRILRSDDPLLELTVPGRVERGIHALRLEGLALELDPEKTYSWNVALVMNAKRRSNDIFAQVFIARTPLTSVLAQSLKGAQEFFGPSMRSLESGTTPWTSCSAPSKRSPAPKTAATADRFARAGESLQGRGRRPRRAASARGRSPDFSLPARGVLRWR